MIAQIARAVFADFPPGFYFVIATTGMILVLAANTAFNGFPVLGSILARDGFLPRQLGSRGDRLAYSNGILILALMAIALIIAFDAEVTRLIQLYIVGVFVSFNLSQLGMIRHWTRHLRSRDRPGRAAADDPLAGDQHLRPGDDRGRARDRAAHEVPAGAWIAILAMGVFFVLMKSIRRHYDKVGRELTIEADDQVLPTRVHAIVLVSKVHKPTMRALAYAKATRPNVLEAVLVDADPDSTARIIDEWDGRGIDVPLKVLDSPYREIIRPIVEYVRTIRDANPRGVVAVYIPEYVVGRWWEQLLHNQTALRLKGRLLFTAGVMVISVPYQLRSSEVAEQRASARPTRSAPVTSAAARCCATRPRTTAGTCIEPRPRRRSSHVRPRPRARKPRGRSLVGERYDVRADRSRTAARRRPPRRRRRVRPARAARRAGGRRGHRGRRGRPVPAR